MNGYALSFDMDVTLLKQFYGNPYNPAYLEIRKELEKCGFYWFQGSTYMTGNSDLTSVVRVWDGAKTNRLVLQVRT